MLRSTQAMSARESRPVIIELSASASEQSMRARVQHYFEVALFCLSLPAMLIITASLMVSHWYTLPKPAKDDLQVRQALAELRTVEEMSEWMAVHVLYADCACSRRVLDHLFSSKRPSDLIEKVVLVGTHQEFERRALEADYDLIVIKPKELKSRFNLESAPLLIVANEEGELRYMGGYTERKQGLAIRDLDIISALRDSGNTKELPLFGCAVSKRLQQFLDPLGVKYSFQKENGVNTE